MNKILEHLKQEWYRYGIETLVVIVGILVAFTLNGWKEDRAQKELEKEILRQIAIDLSLSLSDVVGDLERIEQSEKSYRNIKKYIDADLPYNDSLCFDFYYLIADQFTMPVRTGYNTLQENGFELVSNDSLRNFIMWVYESALPRLEPSTAFFPDLADFMGPYYDSHFKPNTDPLLSVSYIFDEDTVRYPRKKINDGHSSYETIGYVPLDFEDLKKDTHFLMLFDRSRRIRTHKLLWYGRSELRMRGVIDRIEKELKIL